MTEAFDQITNQLSKDININIYIYNARWAGEQIDAIDGGSCHTP